MAGESGRLKTQKEVALSGRLKKDDHYHGFGHREGDRVPFCRLFARKIFHFVDSRDLLDIETLRISNSYNQLKMEAMAIRLGAITTRVEAMFVSMPSAHRRPVLGVLALVGMPKIGRGVVVHLGASGRGSLAVRSRLQMTSD